MKPYNARVIVNTPGTAVPLSEAPMRAITVTVVAFAANTEDVHIGARGVRARAGEANGLPIAAREAFTWNDVDLSEIWIDAEVALEGVSCLAWL